MTAGGSAAFVGTPAEVALIRSVLSSKAACPKLEVVPTQSFDWLILNNQSRKAWLIHDNCFRMTSDGSLPADKRRNYSSVFNAIARIYKVSTIVS